ncbi:hypothetical protein Bca101_009560 [Brassica carinata]
MNNRSHRKRDNEDDGNRPTKKRMQVYHRKVQTNNGQDVPLGDITNSVPIPSKDSRCQRRILMSQKRKHPMPSLESMQVETVTQSQNLVQTIGTAPSQVINPRGQGQSPFECPQYNKHVSLRERRQLAQS